MAFFIFMETEQQRHHAYQTDRRAAKRDCTLLDFLPYPIVVLKMDHTVSYLNPAFVNVFGWTLEDLEGKEIPFVPDIVQEQNLQEMQQLFSVHQIHALETQRLTRDGRMLDVVLDGAIFYEEDSTPAGQILTLRDITREKRVARSQHALFRISQQIHQVQGLDDLLEFITKEVQTLLNAGGAMVILLDEERQEFFFRVATLDSLESSKKMQEVRFPADKGVAGHVYRTGQSLIVPDTSQSPYFFKKVDLDAEYHTRNMLDVPLETRDRRIGVLCVVNKKDGMFDQQDVDFLSTIASTIALPIENARIHEELKQSYQEIQSLNRAKDQVIHHLSHELKTPVSVVSASLSLLQKRLSVTEAHQGYQRLLDRAQRNLQRILDMQYEIEDILRDKEYATYHLLSILLDACVDELEVLVADEFGEWNVMQRIRRRIEELFGPQDSISQRIPLAQFVQKHLDALRPRFAHRTCQITFSGEATPVVLIPPDVLSKIVEGLIRNAVENTPDGGKIEAMIRNGAEGPEFEVKDFGVGITPENQRLIFENYFPPYDTMRYSSRNPFDFNAGGKGFDLLRLKIFSERYHFKLQMRSQRCQYLLHPETICPGKVEHCAFCHTPEDCVHSGGTTMLVRFMRQEYSDTETL
ncbi:multi-sensor signal transduction histidine kinase [Candidatus Vecturithrix granuli]|uniref:histidine kinase n=1 Tax=Vecturithrix granuli TaxID=1499967 RepID=A0A081BVN2_VECG1|nr:multi-sensor signal transduction histidine kinase [Candidatus Vecturithrix granuli]